MLILHVCFISHSSELTAVSPVFLILLESRIKYFDGANKSEDNDVINL